MLRRISLSTFADLVRMTDARDVRPVKSFAGQKVHAVAGIGDPKRFFLQLARFGLKPVPHPFPDHHPFRAGDLDWLAEPDEEAALLTLRRNAMMGLPCGSEAFLKKLERHFYTTSSCGVCGKSSIDAVKTTSGIRHAPVEMHVTSPLIFSLPVQTR